MTGARHLDPIGHVSSPLTSREHAPKQGYEGAPPAWLILYDQFAAAADDLAVGDEIVVLTWLHQANRSALRVHPRDDANAPLRGVFSTRSQDRPNPIGIHRVTIVEMVDVTRIKVLDLEAFDGTPILDIKPVLDRTAER